jgi:hypothetical protein
MRISEIIPEGYVGQKSPVSGKNPTSKKKQDAIKKVEDLAEGPIWDKAKNVMAGAALAGAALGAGPAAAGTVTTTSFSANAGTPEYAQMEELTYKYYNQMLEKAKASGVDITVNMVRRWKQDAQYYAIRDLSK